MPPGDEEGEEGCCTSAYFRSNFPPPPPCRVLLDVHLLPVGETGGCALFQACASCSCWLFLWPLLFPKTLNGQRKRQEKDHFSNPERWPMR